MTELANTYSYKYEEFMSYQEVNNVLPKSLQVYCVKEYDSRVPQINNFADQVNDIITIITKGDDPNDLIFKNKIKFFTNTIGQNNYETYLSELKKINYGSKTNVQFLITELIRCSIICRIACTGYNLEEKDTFKQVPEVCADILKQLSSFVIKSNSKTTEDINFNTEILSVCRHFFNSYIDPKRSMDEHNTYNADNYKGFMTFMGLLYERNILSNKIVIDCLGIIRNIIYTNTSTKDIDPNTSKIISRRDNTECGNFHKGYEHLLNHMLHSIKIKTPELLKIFLEKEKIINGTNELVKKIDESGVVNSDVLNILDSFIAEKTFQNIVQKLNKNNFSQDELDSLTTLNINENIVFKSVNELKYHLQNNENIFKKIIIDILLNENIILRTLTNNIRSTIIKNIEAFNQCVQIHQDIRTLNGKYLSHDSSKHLVQPLRKYMELTHDVQGETINKIADYLERIQQDILKDSVMEPVKKYIV